MMMQPKPLGREAAVDAVEVILQSMEFTIGELRSALKSGKSGDDAALKKAAYTLWAMQLQPLAAYRCIVDYVDGNPVDLRPDPDEYEDPADAKQGDLI